MDGHLAKWPFFLELSHQFAANMKTNVVLSTDPKSRDGHSPMSLLNYLNLASRQHVLIKACPDEGRDGRSLELRHFVTTVIFDKTGTLTLEQPQVKTVHLCANLDAGLSEDTILTVAAAAEQRQSHPIAKAILAAFDTRVLPTISDAHYELGDGLRVWLENDEHTPTLVRVGSTRFMDKIEQLSIPAELIAIQTASHELGHSLVVVGIEDKLVGAIELQPTIRPEAHEVIEALHQRNLTTAIISGAASRTLARELGIERYLANVLPFDAAAFVSQLQAEGQTVCFVGALSAIALIMPFGWVSGNCRLSFFR